MTIHEQMDLYAAARKAIMAHVGYEDGWSLMTLSDCREHYWAVDPGERRWFKHSPSREALAYWLRTDDESGGPHGNELYSSEILTHRDHKKWVYRGAELTLVIVDTQTDGNIWLEIVRNDREVKV